MESRVFFTVFAGRRRFLGVLMAYVAPLLEQRVIDHVHLWDYCRLAADREYLKGLPSTHKGVEVIQPPPSDAHAKFPNKWKGYYAYYASLLKASDFLIKCDDDVVFIANLPVLLRVARKDHGVHHLFFPSIVNNDVAASFQAADGVVTDPEYVVTLRASRPEGRYSRTPISDWYNCTQCAQHIHSKFLSKPDAFFTGCIHEWSVPARVPINFFLMGGAAVREHFAGYATEAFVDEPYFTALLTERTRRPSLMVTDAVVVHFSFGFQHMPDERQLLDRYRQLSRDGDVHARLSRNFGERVLSQTCPSSAPPHLMQGKRNLSANDVAMLPQASSRGGGGKIRGGGGGGGGGGKGRGAGGKGRGTARHR